MSTATSDLICLDEEVSFTADARIDEAAGVLRGVRILGKYSRNGREYSDNALREAAAKYEGIGVNVDHERNPSRERRFDSAFGQIRNVRMKGEAVYGDFHYLKSHPAAPRLVEIARRMPDRLGFSHHAEGPAVTRGGKQVVEGVDNVKSVDLVQNPATNKGIWESFLVEDGARLPPDAALASGAGEGEGASMDPIDSAAMSVLQNPKLNRAKKIKLLGMLVDAASALQDVEDEAGSAGEKPNPEGDDEPVDAGVQSTKRGLGHERKRTTESEEPRRCRPNFVTGKHTYLTDSQFRDRQMASIRRSSDISESVEPAPYPETMEGFVSQLRYTAPVVCGNKKGRGMTIEEQRQRHENINGGRDYGRIVEAIRAAREPSSNPLVEACRGPELNDRELARLTEQI